MADYTAAANSIYDPQAAGESTLAKSALDSSISSAEAGKADLIPYYQQAFAKLQSGEDMSHGKQAAADNMAGLLDSGLHQNQDAGITKSYASDRSSLSTEQGSKVAAYDRQEADAKSGYSAALSAILDKYNGQKAAYISNRQGADEDRAFQQRLADSAAANARQIAGAGNANALAIAKMYTTPQTNPASGNVDKLIAGIHQYFDGYNAHKSDKGYTEMNVQPKVQELAARLGIDPSQANDLMYGFRRSQFGQ